MGGNLEGIILLRVTSYFQAVPERSTRGSNRCEIPGYSYGAMDEKGAPTNDSSVAPTEIVLYSVGIG